MTPTTAASESLYRAHGHLESVSWRLALAGRKRAPRVPHRARDQGADVTGASRDHEQGDVAAGRQSTAVAYDSEPPVLLTTPADHAASDLSPMAADADAALRADVRRVVGLLGESLGPPERLSTCSTWWNGYGR